MNDEFPIDQLANQLLFSTSLEEKLWMPTSIGKELSTIAIPLPESPGRPSLLSFGKGRSPFPSPKSLQEDSKRAEALLFFANHELLAIELMSLCILRFPETPWKFRRGLMNIISEEQEHLRLYMTRARELGKEIGSVPVNRFFWDNLYTMRSPEEFLCAMSLTFEQANLDHCQYYGALFKEVGDQKSASIMELIYEDEIRHLRHGRHWSTQYATENLWDFHQKHLSPPLTPARAKGKIFDEEGRKKAGLSPQYIQSLKYYNSSKGRVPSLWICNPNVELQLSHSGPQPKFIRKVQESLSLLLLFLCKRDDILLLPSLPSPALQKLILSLGFPIPELCLNHASLSNRSIKKVIPWGKSPQYPCNNKWTSIDRTHYTKSYGASSLQEFITAHPHPLLDPKEPIGISCRTIKDVENAITRFSLPIIIKADLGASGRNATRFMGTWEHGQKEWLIRTLNQQGSCVVEPLLQKIIDFSIQIWIEDTGKVRYTGPMRFFTSPQGQYLGHWLGPVHKGLSSSIIQHLHKNNWKTLLKEVALFIGKKLYTEGHRGAAGIDCLLHKKNDTTYIRPIVEINPRHTMGQIAQALGKRCRGPAIFSISKENTLPTCTPTISKGLCTKANIQLNDPHNVLGTFLTVSHELCTQWCAQKEIPFSPTSSSI